MQARIDRLGPLLRRRTDAALLALIVVVTLLLPGGLPLNIAAIGLVAGCSLALQSVGMILVYRSNHVINFAQAQFGMVAGVLLYELLYQNLVLVPVYYICGRCVVSPAPGQVFIAGDTLNGSIALGWGIFEFIVSAAIALAVAAGVALLTYHAIIRRFQRAPRLILAVVTVAIATALGSAAQQLGSLLTFHGSSSGGVGGELPLPLPDVSIVVDGHRFHTIDLLMVMATVIALTAVGVYFRSSTRGTAVRAGADNPERGATLGINVGGVTGLVWMAAGILSGIAAMFSGVVGASADPTDIGIPLIIRILAVAVIARMGSLRVAVIAAFVLSVAEQASQAAFHSDVVFEAALLVIICAFLALQRTRTSRAEQDVAASWPASREVRPIPRELRHLPAVSLLVRGAVLLLVVVLLGFPWIVEPSSVANGSAMIIFAILAFSLLILTGWAGHISLGQMALAGVGAYIAAMLGGNAGVPFLLVLPVAAAAGGAASLLVGVPALRIRGLFLGATTLAFALVVSDIVIDGSHLGAFLPVALNRPLVLGVDFADERVFYYFSILCLVLVMGAVTGMRRSRTARALIAIRDNPAAAQSFGISLVRTQLAAFVISGAIAGFAGALFAYEQHGVQAATFLPTASIALFMLAVIGGFGYVIGPLIAAAFSFAISSPLFAELGEGGGLIVLLLLAPGGLTQVVVGVRDALLRQIALRHHLLVPSILADSRPGGAADQRAVLAAVPARKEPARTWARYRLDGQWGIATPEVAE